jgi:hypothetical protein
MRRFGSILGLAGGLVMIASSGAHSILGWKGLAAALRAALVPADLIQALSIGWCFGGVAMLAFGLIVIASFWRRMKGIPVSMFAATVVGATYVVFGAGALLASRMDPFFVVFIVPGMLVLVGSYTARTP